MLGLDALGIHAARIRRKVAGRVTRVVEMLSSADGNPGAFARQIIDAPFGNVDDLDGDRAFRTCAHARRSHAVARRW